MKKAISRRSFQKVWARQGLAIAVAQTPSGFQVRDAGAWKESEPAPGVTLRITPDELVTISIYKPGLERRIQGELPFVLANELDADWRSIRIHPASQGDGGAQKQAFSAIKDIYEPLRLAGAAAREMLLHAAAREWNVAVEECCGILGKIRHLKTNRMVSYGQVAERASKLSVPQKPALKPSLSAGAGQPVVTGVRQM